MSNNIQHDRAGQSLWAAAKPILVLNCSGSYWLQSATNVAGPYATLTGATSPFTNAMTAPQQFFRLTSTNAS